MHIILLTQYFSPEIGAPQARLSEMTKHLVDAGHQVTILTAMPNYPHGIIQDGYGGFFMRDEYYGARVYRSFIYPTQKATFLHRLSNYFSFVISSAIVGAFVLKKADFLLVQSPPLFLGLSGLWLSFIKRTKMIFNVSDLWPESAARIGIIKPDGILFKFAAWLEKLCYQRAYLVCGQSLSTVNNIRSRFPDVKVYHLSNGVDVQMFSESHRRADIHDKLSNGAKFTLSYAGLHGLPQGLDQILHVAKLLEDLPIHINLIGDGSDKERLLDLSQSLNLTNLTFHDSLPKKEIPAIVASSDALFIPLKTYIPGAVPSKLYEAMASGKPSIVIAEGEPADIVTTYEAGIAVKPGDIEGIAKAVRQLYEDQDLRHEMGQNARQAVEDRYSRDKISSDFIAFLSAELS